MKVKSMKVVRVTKTEFELENRRKKKEAEQK